MKKTLAGLMPALLALALCAGTALAGDYAAEASSASVSDAETLAPQLPGPVKAERFVISNATSTVSAGQVVTVYRNCSSTQTVSAVLSVYVPGGSAPVTVEYPFYSSPLLLTDACWRKSGDGSAVYVNAHYR